MKFWKAHGLGNDYLVLEAALALDAELVRQICDRHQGVGGDGILEPKPARFDADFGVRIWNPDGSIAEKSGNGLRIYGHYLRAFRGAPDEFTLSTDACRVGCRFAGDALSVEMGKPSFVPSEVPVLADAPLVDGVLDVDGEQLRVIAVGMGNPHCVLFRDEAELDSLPWREWGKAIERHPRFPNRTNVQFAHVLGPSAVEIRIFERGAGETQASGSSSCAVAAAGVHSGRLRPGRISVRMPGGELVITVSDTGILLEGPVEGIGHFELDASWLAARRSPQR